MTSRIITITEAKKYSKEQIIKRLVHESTIRTFQHQYIDYLEKEIFRLKTKQS
jgi:hypothetical protein